MKRIFVALALASLVAACSSNRRAPAARTTYGPATRSAPAPTYRQPTYTATRPMPAPVARTSYGAFRWHSRIRDAQAQARAEGKVILVGSTKPSCGLCEKFKTQIVPSMGSQVSSVAVGYMLQALSPEAPQIWGALKANLPNAGLMPLVGVFSPDLRYLAGFGGPPDQAKLMRALSQARATYRGAAPVRRVQAPSYRTAQLNEYGEYEWAPTGALWPQDALKPDLASNSQQAPVLAAAPTPVPSQPAAAAPAIPEPAVAAAPAPARAPAPMLSPATPYTGRNSQALAALDDALGQIRSGDRESAKVTLAQVRKAHAGDAIAREAAKGEIAIWNIERIESAGASDRAKLRDRARENLRGSMWTVLFS